MKNNQKYISSPETHEIPTTTRAVDKYRAN